MDIREKVLDFARNRGVEYSVIETRSPLGNGGLAAALVLHSSC